jgi:hypothetical protein
MSYGTDAPQGLQASTYLNGSTWNGSTGEYPITSGYATNIFSGDPVTVLSDGSIGIGVAGAAIVGVFTGVKFKDSLGVETFSPYWPASTVTFGTVDAQAQIVDDPDVLFDIQATVASLDKTDFNLNADFVAAAGSTATGQSAFSIDMGSVNTTATLNLKLIRLTPNPENTIGVSFNNALVLINNHKYKGGTGTTGV